jgi:hybrid polyketide synthase/nonribosomal peptide synthetase ACE1
MIVTKSANGSSNSDHVDIQALRVVGENLPAIIRGDASLLGILTQEDLLSKLYAQSLGIDVYLEEVARIARQISHRYPHLNILEIG